jgi:Tol biopolymer transport system component
MPGTRSRIRVRSSSVLTDVCAAIQLSSAAAQQTLRVSVDSSGAEGNGDSVTSAVSADGTVVAFKSIASNLVAGDVNATWDIFAHDRATGLTERVSVDSSGGEANDWSDEPSISSDGQLVAFLSLASNLVANDTNGVYDIFVHDRATGLTERVSVDSTGAQANGYSVAPSLSADGRFVAFASDATNLVAGDTNGFTDIFVHDRVTGVTERVSVDSSGGEGDGASNGRTSLSSDGAIVAFDSDATNFVPGDTNGALDVFVHDRSSGTTERVSVRSNGNQGNSISYAASLSADGKVVAFQSLATNLVPFDSNFTLDVFVHDRRTATTERVSVDSSGGQGNKESELAWISADGNRVAFQSDASNLVAGDTNVVSDVFIHDRSSGLTERVSVDSGGAQANGGSRQPSLAADGLSVAFESPATNLVANDRNRVFDVFVHELCSTPASWSNYGAGLAGTLGVPSFTSRSNPVLGSVLTLDLGNSYGASTVGVLCIGFQRASIRLEWGGDLLLVPMFAFVIGLPPGGTTGSEDVPSDLGLCAFAVDLQALEYDPGAAKGVSFTPGLELLLGR